MTHEIVRPIAITMGDPAGIGPELCLRMLAEDTLPIQVDPIDSGVMLRGVPIVVGDHEVLLQAANQMGIPYHPQVIAGDQDPVALRKKLQVPTVFDVPGFADFFRSPNWCPGVTSAETGLASYRFITTAIDLAMAGIVHGVATGPIQKHALHAAGIPFPGHTEIFATRTGTEHVCMMLTSDALSCSLVTTHIGLRDVASQLTTDAILRTIELTGQALQRWRGRVPRLVVCALNPHAGEQGQFGNREEEEIIQPAIDQGRARGYLVEGPLPADTAFVSQRRDQTDGYICMYHDQGLIPLKALAFESAVNVTLGLPMIRTSVDHGTALDIAWRGRADSRSMLAAIQLAVRTP